MPQITNNDGVFYYLTHWPTANIMVVCPETRWAEIVMTSVIAALQGTPEFGQVESVQRSNMVIQHNGRRITFTSVHAQHGVLGRRDELFLFVVDESMLRAWQDALVVESIGHGLVAIREGFPDALG